MENLGVDGKLLLAQIINFVLFFILIKKFIVKPFTAFINKERSNEEGKNKLLDDLKKRELESIESEKEMREKIKKELEGLYTQAKKEAQQLRVDLLKKAEEDANEIKEKNKKSLEEKEAFLYKEIKDKIIDTSLSIVENSFKESLDKDARKAVTSYIVKNYKGKLKINEN